MARSFRLGLRDRDTWLTVLVVASALAVFVASWMWANRGGLGPLTLLLPFIVFLPAGLLAPRRWLAIWLTTTAGVGLVSYIAGEVAVEIRNCAPRALHCDEGGFAVVLFGVFTILAGCSVLWGSLLRIGLRRRRRGLNQAAEWPPT
ncbi:MAG: hypothetical protein AABX89_00675 [Candidatus Thermoplasmatota archaeon]